VSYNYHNYNYYRYYYYYNYIAVIAISVDASRNPAFISIALFNLSSNSTMSHNQANPAWPSLRQNEYEQWLQLQLDKKWQVLCNQHCWQLKVPKG